MHIYIYARKPHVYPKGSQLATPLGPLVLNSWLISSLSLFSTNLTNYLIWKPDRVLLSLY